MNSKGDSPAPADRRTEPGATTVEHRTRIERDRLVRVISHALRGPMALLGIVWVALLVIELSVAIPEPWGTRLQISQFVIWGIFLLHFLFEFLIAPSKMTYLRGNWLTAIAVVLPAFRALTVFRIFRLVRVVRSVSLLRIITSANRGLRSIGRIAGVGAFPYVMGASALVVFVVAGGMAYFERDSASGIDGFGEALWWSAAMLTTIGSQRWPETLEGRMLGLAMMVYGMAVFGYITATLAGYFVRRNSRLDREEAGDSEQDGLRGEIRALRIEVESLRNDLRRSSEGQQ